MVRVVGGEQNAVARFCECSNLPHHLSLITEVKVGGWLVEHDELGFLCEGARKQNQLSFSTGDHGVRPRGKSGDPKAFERGLGDSMIFGARSAEQAAMGGTAHQNDSLYCEREGADMHLRNIGNDPRTLPDAIISGGFVPEPYLARLWSEETKQRLEQRGFAATVWPKQSKHFAGGERDVEAVTHGTVWITDGKSAAFDIHDQVFCILARSQIKNGVPTTAVKMPSGSSTSAAGRASVSMSSRYPPPSRAAVGNSRAKSGPTSERARCGTTRPTQPIMPAVATLAEVVSVAAETIATRSGAVAMPSERASSSGSDIT